MALWGVVKIWEAFSWGFEKLIKIVKIHRLHNEIGLDYSYLKDVTFQASEICNYEEFLPLLQVCFPFILS